MKATVQTLTAAPTTAPVITAEKSWFALLADLVKVRLTTLVLLTTLVGFYLGETGPLDYGLMVLTMLGTGLLAGGAAALNQWLERDYDACMERTKDRPLPSGRMLPQTVLVIGWGAIGAGLGTLALGVNGLTALLGALTVVCYLFVYTPLKRKTWLNTTVGAIPGALPPLMGWTAAQGELGPAGWALFAILFFWQVPHFMAIAWLYREEYAKAGFKMLPVVDPEGSSTGRQAVTHALALLVASICPVLLGVAGNVFLVGAVALGVAFVGLAVGFARGLTTARARGLFYMSITYLPLILILLVVDKIRH